MIQVVCYGGVAARDGVVDVHRRQPSDGSIAEVTIPFSITLKSIGYRVEVCGSNIRIFLPVVQACLYTCTFFRYRYPRYGNYCKEPQKDTNNKYATGAPGI
jgi:hypothetical protein